MTSLATARGTFSNLIAGRPGSALLRPGGRRHRCCNRWTEALIPCPDARGEIVGGVFLNDCPGGPGLTSGAVLGRRAGAGAARERLIRAQLRDRKAARTSMSASLRPCATSFIAGS